MFTVFVVFVAIIAVLLILVVLIQNSKGGGLTGEFGSAGASQMFGVQRTTDLIEKITWGLVGTLAVLALVSHLFIGAPQEAGINSVNVTKAQSKATPVLPAAPPANTAPAATPAPAK
jgi:preprotein translocase subunit SecG